MPDATFDAIVVASSPHANEVILGLTLVERGRRVATRLGARRVLVLDDTVSREQLVRWEAERGAAALVVLRAGDQLVHPPLVQPMLGAAGERRLAVGPDDVYAGALWAEGAAATEVVDALASSPATGDLDIAAAWHASAQRIPHGAIARHAATTRAERKGATRFLLQILVKQDEDSPVSKYIYRPLSRPLTQLLLHTSITPNQVSYIVGVIGLVGCFLTALPGQANLVWGAGLVFASGILDGCDGEIARLKHQYSSYGAWLDTVIDELTQFSYLVAIGIHTYHHHPEPWIAASVVTGAICYVTSIYAIYYFCIVVIKKGGSQYYVGDLVIVDAPDGPALSPRRREASKLPAWMQAIGQVLLYVIRRDFINLAAFALAFANLYQVIYGGIWIGAVVAALVIVPEHVKLRRQLGELRRRGGPPRFVSA